jgi:putative transposase
MPRDARLDFKNAVHYVSLRGRAGAEIFFNALSLERFPFALRHSAPHARRFETMLGAVCAECGALLYGYCVEPNSAILVLRVAGAPLQALMRRLNSRYSRYLRAAGLAQGKGVFAARYESKAIAPEYLLHALRRAHRSPIANGLCIRPVDYPFSSDRVYAGAKAPLPIAILDVKAALEQKGYFGSRGYREFMGHDETPHVADLLTHGSPLDSRVVGDKVFVQRARYMAAHPASPPTREQFIAGAAQLLNQTPADIVSATLVGVLGRALVAWYALRTGAVTLSDVGRWFSVTGGTLEQAIRHHRGRTPHLFDLPALPGLEADPDE